MVARNSFTFNVAAIVSLLFAIGPASAHEWFVASAGSDANIGSHPAPFRTIQRAASVAMPGDTVFVEAGIYRETVTPPRSGLPGKPIVFESYGKADAIIDGCARVVGFARYRGEIYAARISNALGSGNDQVFVDGVMLPQARHPAAGPDPMRPTLATAAAGTDATHIVDPTLTEPAGYWVGATVWLLGGNQTYEPWIAQTATITASAPGSISFGRLPDSTSDYTPVAGSNYCIVGGPRSCLDAPGEWWIGSGLLYLWLPNGRNPSAYDIEIRQRTEGFVLDGLSDIVVKNLSIFASGISLLGSSDCSVVGCRLRYLSQFTNIANGWDTADTTGIAVSGSGNRVDSCLLEYSAGNGVSLGGEGNTATNCYVRGCDYSGEDSAGIRAFGMNQTVTHNTVTECGRSGILNRALKHSLIACNDVSYYGMLTKDLGGTYCWETDGDGTVIAYNIFHDAVDTLYPDDVFTAGPYLDNGSTNIVVDHNLVYDMPIGIKMNPPSKDNIVVENTVANNGLGPSLAGYDTDYTGSSIIDNIFTGSVDPHENGVFANNLYSSASPHFLDPASGDYRLGTASPAIGSGRPVPPYTNGYGGSAPDIGAFDYGKRAWIAGSSLVPLAPRAVTARIRGSVALVTWEPSAGAVRYRVYDRAERFGPFAPVATASGDRASVNLPADGSREKFVVEAVGRNGSGPLSGFASIIPADAGDSRR